MAQIAASETEVISVTPPELHVYSQLKVRLSNPGQLDTNKGAQFVLKGQQATADGNTSLLEVVLPARTTRKGFVIYQVDNALEFAVQRKHVHFSGEIQIQVPLKDGSLFKTSQPLKLNIFPMGLQNLARDFAAPPPLEPGKALGVHLKQTEQGFLVTGYTSEGYSFYEKASEPQKILPGDIIIDVDGVPVTTKPALSTALVANVDEGGALMFTVKRGGVDTTIALRRMDALTAGMPIWFWQLVFYILAASVLLMGFFAPFAGITSYVERRIAGRIQSRIGPNRVGPQGFLQWLADGLKAFQKEDIIPPNAQNVLFRLAPYFVMAGVFLTFVAIPFSQSLVPADLNIGIFYILAVTSVVVVGIILAGWASNNKWSMLGGFRSAAQMVSYEIPLGLSVLSIALVAGSLSLQSIVTQQGGYPWEWNMFHNPMLTAGFFIFFVSALAEGNRAPFDLPEAEQELVSGYNTEYSGMRFVFFFFAEWANLYVTSALAVVLFLGGWQIPGYTAFEMETSMSLQLLGLGIMTIKCLSLVFVIIWIRWSLPRIRIDQMMTMCWKYLIPFSFVGFLVTALWILYVPAGMQDAVRYALFAGALATTSFFVYRVRYNYKERSKANKHFGGELHY
jgi:NADH-quinone oxidoreductase subunit H